MINLLLAESQRLLARRMTRLFPAILAVLMVGGIVIAYFVIENDASAAPDFVNDIAGGVEATSLLELVANLLPIMAFVIGASYIGADTKTGMIEQLLTWEPRRLRFLTARMISSIVGVGVLAIALASFFIALLYILAALTGTTDGTSAELWGNAATGVLRTGVAAGLFAAFGLGTTILVNSSVGSIVGFVIYWFIVENFLVSAFLPKVAVYLPITNAAAFASGQDVERFDGSFFSGDVELIVQHGYLTAGIILAAWTVLAVAVGGFVFQRRDLD